uniref:Lipopolysaccharide-induced tumor necrosis factor-alpha factor homolog n=1 Tax=Fundulus heteroclitus TaxID=8078 RepID=A0A3Q2P9T4_FUNHE
MENGKGPPPDTAVTPDIQATPYPSAPLYHNMVNQPVSQPAAQQHLQPGKTSGTIFNVTCFTYHVLVMQPMPTDTPGTMKCPHCQNTVVTSTKYKVGTCTWIVAGVLCLSLCWLCCCIPFCVPSCQDVEHSCPSCQNVLHVYKRR